MDIQKAQSGVKRIVMTDKDFKNAMTYCNIESNTKKIAYEYLVQRMSVKEAMETYQISKARLFEIRRTVLSALVKFNESIDNPSNKYIPLAKSICVDLNMLPQPIMHLFGLTVNRRITEITVESKGVNKISLNFALAVHDWLACYFDENIQYMNWNHRKKNDRPEIKNTATAYYNRGWNYMVKLSEVLTALPQQREHILFISKKATHAKIKTAANKLELLKTANKNEFGNSDGEIV